MTQRKFQAVIFDLDGVITDTAEWHYLAWKRLANFLEIPFDRHFNESLKGINRMDSLHLILQRGNADFSQTEQSKLAAQKNQYYLELLDHLSPEDEFPGVPQLLTQLNDMGVKVGLASASKNALLVLERLQLRQMFDYIADAATVIHGKPHPEVFLKAADGLGVPPMRCIGIEDAVSGIQAVNSAGMWSIAVGDPNILKEADEAITQTQDFLPEKYHWLLPHQKIA
ncbi:beta-phosphoglucomutase [Algicola sagamiensis]|uniref:beta-phosphoglucomutase n=1 Tax=Algicola sagamiensis TaxID=163869 RepID=UPI00036A85AB|nr:beta-phosphoglucomutase [Algicola sagamiensis]